MSKAEKISCTVREKLGLSPLDCLDIIALCKEYDIAIQAMTQLPCDSSIFQSTKNGKFSALMHFEGLKTVIVHNDTHHEHRQRSNICHELAHGFLGHTACTLMSEDGARSHNGSVEAEANYLAGALLLPKTAALHVVMNGLEAQARSLYGVSGKMLDYRLKISGAKIIAGRMRAKTLH